MPSVFGKIEKELINGKIASGSNLLFLPPLACTVAYLLPLLLIRIGPNPAAHLPPPRLGQQQAEPMPSSLPSFLPRWASPAALEPTPVPLLPSPYTDTRDPAIECVVYLMTSPRVSRSSHRQHPAASGLPLSPLSFILIHADRTPSPCHAAKPECSTDPTAMATVQAQR